MFIYKKAYECRNNILIPLWVLLWKYTIIRKNRYCHASWEIFGGVIVFLIIFLVNQTVITTELNRSEDTMLRVFYTPYNNFTQRLMTKVGHYLVNNESDILPKPHWHFRSIQLPINENLFNTTNMITVVTFKNNGSLDPDLGYTINVIGGETRSKIDAAYNGFFRSIVPKEETAPPYLGTLQWAIDKSYMEQFTREDIGQKLLMQAKPEYISKELRTLHKFMILCTIIAPLPFFLIHSSKLIVERRTGLRELMKLTGVCSDVLRFSHVVETTFVAILYSIPVTILLKISSQPLLPYSSGFVIAFTLIFHFVNSASLASVTTALSQDFNHADSLGLLLYMSTFILDFLWYSHKEHLFIMYTVCCVLPHAPIYMFWDEVLYLETIGQGTQFWNICRTHSKNCTSVMRVWSFFWIQLIVITSVAWYLDLVHPGPYGVSKKWNFLVKKSYWYYKRNRIVTFHLPAEQNVKVERDERFFERGPRKAEVAIKVLSVTKVFSSFRGESNVTALDSVSFDCYRGEVTMLLGAHGAGKSTLMSIVTGMFSATKGKVFIKGMNVAHKIMELREDLGLCMQKNISFRFLTVEENILFFQKLRRKKSGDALTVEQLMKKLKLTDKADHYSSKLSTGMQRCLQVACTLASGADVLVLDEPTSGMDVEARHRLWDLIMELRGNKTILMSTTYLEEAKALGDRIVLLNNGKLKCHGTPMFLKHAIGTSFNLSITIKDSTQMRHLIDLVHNILPDVKHRVQDIRRITFSLPSKDHEKFPALFEALEGKKNEFGISLIDVGMFMEEVFLEFIEEEEDFNEVRSSISTRHVKVDRIRGIPLIIQQIKMLIKRVHQYSWLKKYQFIILQVLVPIIALLVVTVTTNYKLGHDRMFSHRLSQHDEDEITALVYHVGPFRRRGLFDIMSKHPAVSRVYSLDIDEEFRDPLLGYMNKQTVGLKIADNYSKIFHSRDPRITTKSISMYSNIYMTINMPYLNKSISATYESIMRTSKEIRDPKTTFLCLKWSVWVVFLSVLPLAPLILLSIEEHMEGTRDNHEMAGCSPIVHWFSKLLAHMAQYLVIIPVPVLILTILLDFDKTFNQIRFLGSLLAILLAFGPAFLAHLYFFSFILHKNVAICQVYIMSLCFGIILPVLLSVLEPLWKSKVLVAIPYMILVVIARFSPLFAFAVGLCRLTLQARLNAYCKLNRQMCPNLVFDDASFSSKVCCESTSREPFKYLVSYETGLYDFLNLIVLFIFYAMLVIALDNRILHYIIEQIALANYQQPVQAFNDPSVRTEIKYVQEILQNRQYGTNILIADNLHKDYVNLIQGKHRLNAVKGVSFAAKLGECIAILGPQGAGKSSLLKMLAGSHVMTRGNSCIDGRFIRRDRSNYIHKISLTSSTGGMDSFMTGHQNLVFIAQLQGYADEMAAKLSHLALRFMGLHPNETPVSKYSTGCLRRLSLCSTLVLAPLVALLDEPMMDIDANTKPLVAKALQRLILEPAAVIVAQASVDWRQMQPVFSRIAIMSKGQLATIGPAAEVLAALANGYTARIKLKVVTAYREDRYMPPNEYEDSSESESEEEEPHSAKSVMYAQSVVDFKREFQKSFETSRCTAEHLCMIYFRIEDKNKTLLYSEMFQKLEELKNKYFDVVEDYTLCSTTVEDVFWSLTHEKQPMI